MAATTRNLIGPYLIQAELGRGGMGVVYLAFDPAIEREIAVKVIRVDTDSGPLETEQLRLRLSREAAAAGRLNHPGIVTVYQLGEHGNSVYIAMEFLRGTALDRILQAGPMRDTREAIRLLDQVAQALDYAHSMGIVHRDVKPANILVSQDGRAKITDFGIARICSRNVTQTGAALGTPDYMAPEQIKALPVDGKADQFSLAVMAFFILSGRKPFEAPAASALLLQIVQAAPLPLCEANPRMPAAAGDVIDRALAKSPEDRFDSCREFVSALGAALSAVPSLPAPVKRAGRRTVICGLLAAAAAAGTVVAGLFVAGRLRQSPPPPVPSSVISKPEPVVIPNPVPARSMVNVKDGLTYFLISQLSPAHSFYLTRTEVTSEAYARFRPRTPSRGNLPASGVTWDDARAYCEWAGGRLPSEAEWEFAAGAANTPLQEVAWFSDNSGRRVREAGGKQPNDFGLHDMQGNVWEWLADARGAERVVRGGSAMSRRQHASTSSRWTLPPGAKDSMIGFRCAVDLPR